MMASPVSREILRFRDFTLDVRGYQLRRAGYPVRLERRPMDLLLLLVDRRPELVSHAEIADRLWGKDVFVDVETGIHGAIRKIRRALRDSPDRPVFVETVPARGYRFIAPIEVVTSTAPVPASHVTLVVLPFENLSGETDGNYLAEGLAEEMVVALDKIDPRRVSVLGRSSLRSYQRTAKPPAQIGRELGADYLVDSSIRSENRRLRITAKLVRVSDQVQLWSESYDREPASVLELQRELSGAIANEIRIRLSPHRLDVLGRRHTRNSDAYDLYLRGVNFANQRTPPTTAKAIEYFSRATAIDPDYALAWAGIALAHAASSLNGDAAPLEVWPRAREAAAQAVRANADLAEAQLSHGYVNWLFEWDWPAAETAFRRAVALDSNFAWAHQVLGHVLSQMGRHREAEPLLRQAHELDPLYAMPLAMSSQVAFQARDYPAALEYARRAIALDGEFWIAYMTRGQSLERLGQNDLALEALTAAARFSGNNSKSMALRGYVLARMGREEEARDVLRALEAALRQGYVPPYAFALIYAGLGERAAVFEWLERAYAARDAHLIFLPVDAKWDPYRADQAFIKILSRCDFMRGKAAS